MLHYVIKYRFASAPRIVKPVTGIIFRPHLTVITLQYLRDIKIKDALFLCRIKQERIIFIYPRVLYGFLICPVIIYGTDSHQYYIGIGCQLRYMIDKSQKGLLVMLLTGIIYPVDSQSDIDDRSLMRRQI